MSNLYNGVIAYPGTTTVTPQIPTPENLPPRGGSSFNFNSMGIFGNLISGGLGILGNKFNNDAIAKENERNRQWQSEQATIAFNRQRQLTKEQNEWNSYKNQRKLMEQAGYNPNLMVSGTAGVAQSNSSTNAPQANTPVTGMPSSVMSPEVINTLANASLLDSERRKNDAETGRINQDTINARLDAIGKDLENNFLKQFGKLKWELQLNQLSADAAFKDSQRWLNVENEKLTNFIRTVSSPVELGRVLADTFRIQADTDLKKADAAKSETEAWSIVKNVGFTGLVAASTASANWAQAGYYNQMTANIRPGGVEWNLKANQSWMYKKMGQNFHSNALNTDFIRRRSEWAFKAFADPFKAYMLNYLDANRYKWKRLSPSAYSNWFGRSYSILLNNLTDVDFGVDVGSAYMSSNSSYSFGPISAPF